MAIANSVQITDTFTGARVRIDATGTENFANAGNGATLSGVAQEALININFSSLIVATVSARFRF